MNAKYRTDYFSKLSEANSPYIQLLEAKKKIFGYRYEVVRNEKSNPKNALAQPQSGTGKPSKSLSSEKAKASRTQYTKKKRSRNDPS